jgi:hypothetical protein
LMSWAVIVCAAMVRSPCGLRGRRGAIIGVGRHLG